MLVKDKKAVRLVQQFEAYLNEVLTLQPKVNKWEGEKSLPLYLRELYAFYNTKLLDTETLLMLAKGEDEQTPATLAKQMLKVREKWHHDLVFVNEAVSSLNRKRMIAQKIPFVIPGNQMYLPMLGVDLREHFKKIHTTRTRFSPSTQVMILDAIYHPREAAYTPTESAKQFGYSTMTMTRAFDEFEQAGLGDHTVRGKERCLRFAERGSDLWEVALPFLKSPVKKKFFVLGPIKKHGKVLSGLSALAEYSNLSEPETTVFAVDLEEWQRVQKKEIQVATNSPGPEETGFELWSYSPTRFARNGFADRLSVYLSFKDSGDERVQSAIKESIKGMKW